MSNYLLIGAGFSRNWGGWLADEAFEYLLGCREIQTSGWLHDSLWRHHDWGDGFEGVISEAQAAFTQNPHGSEEDLRAVQDAVSRMFDDMNQGFFRREGSVHPFEFSNDAAKSVSKFLARFDAIFSLNQDLLLEHFYFSEVSLRSNNRWAGIDYAGLSRVPCSDAYAHASFSRSTWVPMSPENLALNPYSQPIFKLHGSSNWHDAEGKRLLIMGGQKPGQISRHPVLTWYAEEFERRLSNQNARLMIIGYGFRDPHINEVLKKAVEKGLKTFVICPQGASIALTLNKTQGANQIGEPSQEELTLKYSLIGASRRLLPQIFGDDDAEFAKVHRFFG